MEELVEITKLCNLLYKYYSEYVLRFVEEYGETSAYKFQFSESNAYMLALTKLVDHEAPLFDHNGTGSHLSRNSWHEYEHVHEN